MYVHKLVGVGKAVNFNRAPTVMELLVGAHSRIHCKLGHLVGLIGKHWTRPLEGRGSKVFWLYCNINPSPAIRN